MNHQKIVRAALAATVAAALATPVLFQSQQAHAESPPAVRPIAPNPATTRAATQPAPATQPAKPAPDHVVIRVGDMAVTVADLDAIIGELPPDQQSMVRGGGMRDLAEYLVRTKVLADEAERRKLQDQPKVKRQIDFTRQQILANALAGDVRAKVDDASVKKYYEEHKQQLERIAARHILIRSPGSKVPLREGQKELTEEQAKAKADELYKRVKAGDDFAKLARQESDDTGSGEDGGDLGSFTRGRMVPAFEQAAFGMKEGEISPPVKTQFGWHVIQVTGRFDGSDKLGDQIRTAAGPAKMEELKKELRRTAKVELDEAYLGPPAPEPKIGPGGAPGPDER